jgi:peroxiredoxin
MKRKGARVAAPFAAVLLMAGPAAGGAPPPGERAPAFRLPDLARERVLSSDSLLAQGEVRLLVFWNTTCPDCLDAVLATSARCADCDSLAMIGIVSGEERIGDARRFARDAGLGILNLWDGTGAAAAAYGAANESYAAFLIGGAGTVLCRQVGRPDPLAEFLDAVCARARAPDSARTR